MNELLKADLCCPNVPFMEEEETDPASGTPQGHVGAGNLFLKTMGEVLTKETKLANRVRAPRPRIPESALNSHLDHGSGLPLTLKDRMVVSRSGKSPCWHCVPALLCSHWGFLTLNFNLQCLRWRPEKPITAKSELKSTPCLPPIFRVPEAF